MARVHAVILPWSAFGHLIPFFELSIALAKSGIQVSFLSTPRNIQRLPKIPTSLSDLIDLVSFPLPKLDSNLLPQNAEATTDIPLDKIPYLKMAYDLLHEPVKKFVEERSPHWLIIDFVSHWAVDIARELNVPLIRYYIVSATTAVFFGAPQFLVGDKKRSSPEDWTVPPEWIDFPSNIAYRKHEAIHIHHEFYKKNPSGEMASARLAKILEASDAIAIRTCPEFEADYLRIHAKITGKPVFPVGFLLQEINPEEKKIFTQEPWISTFQWLDKQKPNSVVFVGFGSELQLNKEQIYEIAYGLELSGQPFLWGLKNPYWANDETEALPPGFCCRTAGKGIVHIGWAPQREILAHPSIGGSLFHAGWGSIIENLQFGNCLVFLPFIIDQPLNSRLLVEKGLAIEVERGEDGSFSRNDIANALQKAMILGEGEKVRIGAREAAHGIFSDERLHDSYIEKFVEYLKNGVA